MKDMENRFSKQKQNEIPHTFPLLLGAFHHASQGPKSTKAKPLAGNNRGKGRGVYGTSRRGSHALCLSLVFHIPQGPGKGAGEGRTAEVCSEQKQTKTKKPSHNNTASEAQASHERRIRSKLGSKRQR